MIPRLLLCLLCLLCWPVASVAESRDSAVVTVLFASDVRLRDLAEHYLGDANAWPEILRASQIESVGQLRPGIQLRIPVTAARDCAQAIAELRRLVYRATQAGALIFAKERMDETMSLQAAALSARRDGALVEATRLARKGSQAARIALQESLGNRDVPAEAILDESGGRVERRRPAALEWTAISIDTLLAEQERLRTLSRSFAVVRFRDASRIQMGANAQLTIRRLRQDRLTRREEVGVVLYGGDVRAMMGASASRQVLRVETPGIETHGHSRHYWLQKAPDVTRIANFEGEIEILSRGAAVTVGANQGTLVKPDQPPLPPSDLLAPPELSAPEEGGRIYDLGARLSWSAVDGAETYWLEVARDPGFTQLVLTQTDVPGTGYDLRLVGEGLYFWRVSSVDTSGLPGPAARAWHFRVIRDVTPPYLVVTNPQIGLHTSAPQILIEGQTEAGATLAIKGESVPVAPDGHYRYPLRLTPGANQVRLEARDPAGNLQRVERVFYRTPESEVPLEIAPDCPRDAAGRLLVNRSWIALDGKTLPGSSVRVTAQEPAALAARTVANEQGRFELTLPVRSPRMRFQVLAMGPQGRRHEEIVEILLDRTPPRIHLDGEPPERTAEPILTLRGQLVDGERLSLAERPISLDADGRFSAVVPLNAGPNRIVLSAWDAAGNERRWERTLVLDRDPPRLTDYHLSDSIEGSQRILFVEIEAADMSGLVAGMPYRVEAGSFVHQGVARRCPDRTCYRDRLVLPSSVTRQARLSSVTLQDYLGNRLEIDLD